MSVFDAEDQYMKTVWIERCEAALRVLFKQPPRKENNSVIHWELYSIFWQLHAALDKLSGRGRESAPPPEER